MGFVQGGSIPWKRWKIYRLMKSVSPARMSDVVLG